MAVDLEKLEDSSHLLELLIQMESILDSVDLYIFKNWLDGEVVEGPVVRRHWVSFSLLYPSHKMPDPRASLRLLKHDIMVEFSKAHQNGSDFTPIADNEQEREQKNIDVSNRKSDKVWFWFIKITFPRRLLNQAETDLDFYDDEIDSEQVEDAKDSGIDSESAYSSDEKSPMGDVGEEAGNDENPFA